MSSPYLAKECDAEGRLLSDYLRVIFRYEQLATESSVETSVKLMELLAENPKMTLREVVEVVGKSVRAV